MAPFACKAFSTRCMARLKFARHPGPVGGVDPGIATERIDAQPRIVRQCHHASPFGGGVGLDAGVLDERGSGLLGFRQTEFAGRDEIKPERVEQLAKFLEFAAIVGGNNQTIAVAEAEFVAHRPSTCFCISTSSPMPLPASAIR